MNEFVSKRVCKYGPLPPDPMFHKSYKFYKETRPNYQDNSLGKSRKSKEIFMSKESLLTQSRQQLNTVLSKHRLLKDRVESFSSECFDYFKKRHDLEEANAVMNKAAIKLQRFFRKYMIRIFLDVDMIQKRREILDKQLNDLDDFSNYCHMFVGKVAKTNAILIQKAYKRRLFLKKIQRISQVYYTFKTIKEEKAEKILKIYLKFFACTEKIELLKYLEYREIKLGKIRRKLSLIKIKQIIRREKINIRLIKFKIRKLKRSTTLIIPKHRERIRKYSSMSPTKVLATEGSFCIEKSIHENDLDKEEDDEQHTSATEKEEKEREKEKERAMLAQLERKEKISLGFISYNVKRAKYKFYRKIKKESFDEFLKNSHGSRDIKNKILFDKLENKMMPINEIKKIPEKKRTKSYKINYKPDNYLRDTENFELHRFKPEGSLKLKKVPSNFKFNFRGKILLPTISYRSKKREKALTPDIFILPRWNIASYN
ncbi:hypothetical protein SteCoe_14850 [Stentor coeruleus]|uniref:Uncharacterized protein n=1 Tax=Stentor coeruleus TaxID=5963 RepID=A0A1R2C4Z6_9CILI|nr:hypothetical protein SteCoe_14850 [Stentor coeruleus]